MLSAAESPVVPSTAPARKRYARIPEVLPVPNLIELQLESFKWFIEKGLRELAYARQRALAIFLDSALAWTVGIRPTAPTFCLAPPGVARTT